jgi:hypothetical protein
MAAASPNSANEPEDPQGLIRQVLAMGSEFPGPAGDVLLSWLLELKDRADPATAAAVLIERHGLTGPPFPPGPLGELIGLLHETARYSAERLNDMGGRRRGGRRGRVGPEGA